MRTIQNLIAAAALFAATSALADATSSTWVPDGEWFPRGDDEPGVLGKRWVNAGASIQNFQSDEEAYGFGGTLNVPVTKRIDVGGSYGYGFLNSDSSPDQYAHHISGHVTVYRVIERDIKPFLTIQLGNVWGETTWQGIKETGRGQFWSIGAGAEFPYKHYSLLTTLSYDDDFSTSSQSAQSWYFRTELNYWATRRVAGYVSVGYNYQFHNFENSWIFGAGVRVRL